MKSLKTLFALLLLCALTSCSSSSGNQTGQTDGVVTERDTLDDTSQITPDTFVDTQVDLALADQPGDTTDSCTPKTPVKPTSNFFTEISKTAGIRSETFVTTLTKAIPINDHSRLAFVDLNNDGYDDIVMHSLFPNAQNGTPFEHLVFLNNGDGTFKPWSDQSGLRNIQAGFFAFADIDNDGDQDCFAGLDIPLSGKKHQILLNDGSGRFTVLANSGVEVVSPAANAVFADFNNDGKLDLYIGNGGTSYASPDMLFFGNGDGTFVSKSGNLSGNPQQPSNGSVTCDFDDDGDLDIIVSTYGVSANLGLNVLWQNNGDGTFTNVAVEKGFASLPGGNYFLSTTGNGTTPEPGKQPGGYMGSNGFGIDCKDVNDDGLADILLTTISHPVDSDYKRKWSDPSQLLINLGPTGQYGFENQWLQRKLPFNEGDVDGAMIDFDNDGRLDISISRDKKYEGSYTNIDQKAWFGLMWQQSDGSFKSLGPNSGINRTDATLSASLTTCQNDNECSNGETCLRDRCRHACLTDSDCPSADEMCGAWWSTTLNTTERFCKLKLLMKNAQNHVWADIDHDGDLDLLVGGRDTGGGRYNFLFRNEIGSQNRWIAIRLQGDGVKINRDAIGAQVRLVFSDRVVMREVQSSRGMYNSIDSRILHFGLGDLGCGYTVEVRWPDGTKATLKDVPENQHLRLIYPDTLAPATP